MTVATALILAALVAPTRRTAVAIAVGAGALGVHAFVTSLARAENTAAILAAVVLVGAVTALASRSTVEDCPPHRRAIGGAGLFLSLFALPPAIGSALVSVEVTPWWVIRLAAASVVLVLLGLVLVRRWLTPLVWYAFAAVVTSVVIRSMAPLLSDTAESVGVYAAAGLVVIAAAMVAMPPGSTITPAAACATPTALLLAIDVVPPLWTAFITPYAWLGAVWSGAPNGVGLTPPGYGLDTAEIRGAHAVALAGLALSVAIASYAVRRTARAAAGGLFVGSPAAIVVGLAAANPSWPTVAAVSLLLGLWRLAVSRGDRAAGAAGVGVDSAAGRDARRGRAGGFATREVEHAGGARAHHYGFRCRGRGRPYPRLANRGLAHRRRVGPDADGGGGPSRGPAAARRRATGAGLGRGRPRRWDGAGPAYGRPRSPWPCRPAHTRARSWRYR